MPDELRSHSRFERALVKQAVLVLALLPLVGLDKASARDAYRWSRVEWDENRIEYGVPGTDDRLLVIACRADGKIDFWGPIPGNDWEFTEGGRIEIGLRTESLRRNVGGKMAEGGNGFNFVTILPPDDPFLVQLGLGKAIEISRPNAGYRVPGPGGERWIKAVVAACKK